MEFINLPVDSFNDPLWKCSYFYCVNIVCEQIVCEVFIKVPQLKEEDC